MNIRHEILRGAADGATLDELIERTGLARPKLKSNIDAAIADGLITRHKDDVTGLPAYKLTTDGKKRLESGPVTQRKEKGPAAVEQPAPVPAAAEDWISEEEWAKGIAEADIPSQSRDDELLKQAAVIVELRAALATAESQRDAWREAIGAVCDADTPEGVRSYISALHHEISTLHDRIDALNDHIDAPAMRQPTGYLVAAPKRPLRRVGKFDTARKLALAAARNGSGRGEVFALVPVGRAVRGAEWREA